MSSRILSRDIVPSSTITHRNREPAIYNMELIIFLLNRSSRKPWWLKCFSDKAQIKQTIKNTLRSFGNKQQLREEFTFRKSNVLEQILQKLIKRTIAIHFSFKARLIGFKYNYKPISIFIRLSTTSNNRNVDVVDVEKNKNRSGLTWRGPQVVPSAGAASTERQTLLPVRAQNKEAQFPCCWKM